MRSSVTARYLVSTVSAAAVGLAGAVASARANDIVYRGLACNELCQAWMGVSHGAKAAEPADRPVEAAPRRLGRAAPRAPTSDRGRAAPEVARLSTAHRPERVAEPAAAKSAGAPLRQVRTEAPLPRPRPTIRLTQGLKGPRRAASVAFGAPETRAAPTAAAEADASRIANAPQAPARPTAPALARVATLPAQAAPSAPSPASAASRMDDAAPSRPGSVPPPAPSEVAGGPAVRTTTDRPDPPVGTVRSGQAAAVPSAPAGPAGETLVAALPTPSPDARPHAQEQRAARDADETVERRASADASFSIHTGAITADPSGTIVEVTIANRLHHDTENLRVGCSARDAQGTTVAEASTRIRASKAEDVALEQVTFPPTITTYDNSFACRIVSAGATASDASKP